MKLPRSYLYVPGNRPERFDKALSSGADAVIIDFEDAVAPADKPAAREAFAAWAASAKPVYVRVNAENSEWFNDDLAACKAPSVKGIILPKAETIGNRVIEFCGDHRLELLPLIETALGMANVASIATTPGVQRLLFGTIDFQFELGIDGDGDELLAFRSQLVLTAKLAGIASPVDGPCLSWDNPEQIVNESTRARKLGFGGKLCIHPKQIASVNVAFSPSDAEIAWARRVVAAAQQSGGAVVAVDGRMIDRPVIRKAEQIIATVTQE